MKNEKISISEAKVLRNKAEGFLSTRHSTNKATLSEVEALKLIQELEVHQVELEMQNDELLLSEARANLAIAKYTELYDFAPSGYFTLSSAGIITEMNFTAARMLEKERSNVVNMRFRQFVSHDELGIFDSFFLHVFESGSKTTCNVKLEREPHKSIFVQIDGLVSEDKTKCLITLTDISDLVLSKKELQLSYARFQTAMDAGNLAWWEMDCISGAVTFHENKVFMIGYKPEQFTHYTDFTKLIHPNDYEIAMQAMRDHLSGKLKRYECEYRLKTASEEYRWFRDLGSITQTDKTGTPLTVSGIVLDITELKNADNSIRQLNEELEKRVSERTVQLETTNKELEAFSYSVSHDLRTPLRALDGFANMLLQDYAPSLDMEGKRMLNVIIANANKMGHLIDDLLSFSHIGRHEMAFELIDMGKMVRAVYEDLATEAEKQTIEFKIQNIPSVYGDKSMIRQVWTNLISNSIKFSAKKPLRTIEIGYGIEAPGRFFFIKDNGAGFNMDSSVKLFSVFHRMHSPKDFQGTGVGLSIVRRIIQRHNGRIWAKAEVNKGAEFYFSLPETLLPEFIATVKS